MIRFISRNVKTKSIEEMLTLSSMLPVTFAAIVPVLSVSAQVDNHWTRELNLDDISESKGEFISQTDIFNLNYILSDIFNLNSVL